jgi:hypothetical protein
MWALRRNMAAIGRARSVSNGNRTKASSRRDVVVIVGGGGAAVVVVVDDDAMRARLAADGTLDAKWARWGTEKEQLSKWIRSSVGWRGRTAPNSLSTSASNNSSSLDEKMTNLNSICLMATIAFVAEAVVAAVEAAGPIHPRLIISTKR